MRIATVSEAKNRLSAMLDLVRGGETVLIVDRGKPVARLESAVTTAGEGRPLRLERDGSVRRPTVPKPDLLREPPPASGASVVAALLQERRSAR